MQSTQSRSRTNCEGSGSRSTKTETGTEELSWNLPHEDERPTENVTGRTWRLPCGCSEPQPQQVIRIADEVLAILAEAALENEQIDKAMEAMGVAQNLEQEENVVMAREEGSKMVLMGLAQAARQGILAGISKTKVRYLGSRLTWNLAFAAEIKREVRISAA